MKIEDYKKALRLLSPDELTDLLRTIRVSRSKPKASNKARKARVEGKGNKPVTKNQVLNLFNGMTDDDVALLLAKMEEFRNE